MLTNVFITIIVFAQISNIIGVKRGYQMKLNKEINYWKSLKAEYTASEIYQQPTSLNKGTPKTTI